MPIYEFYCPDCHMVFNFFSKKINTSKQPDCPKCGRAKLSRQVSMFAHVGSAREEGDMEDMPFDESKMERAMETLAREADGMDENDPRQAAMLMRKMSEMTGMKFGGGMEEAISRMEAGEDPEQIEQEMGDLLEGEEDPMLFPGAKGAGPTRQRPPGHDDTLYDL
ncbi:MAG: zinc ribbon domain-containing protein [Spartobacteria bacterium]|nr:zinc ribbon domain-containing protein [Spartobacteria bacterium]